MHIFVAVMNFFYMFIKLAPAKNKVTFISRQSDRPSLDLRMLGERLAGEGNIEVVILARKLGKTPGAMIGYFFHMFRQMYCIATSQVVLVDSYCIMIKRGEPFEPGDLDITRQELIDAGAESEAEVDALIDMLLDYCLKKPDNNIKPLLLAEAKKYPQSKIDKRVKLLNKKKKAL